MNKDLKAYSDEQLLTLIKQGDRPSFNTIYHKYWKDLYCSAFKIIQDKEASEDVVQEVLVELWIKRHRQTILNLESYLHQCVRFQVFKIIRHNKVIANNVEKDFILSFSTNDADQLLAQKDISQLLAIVIAKLPPKCKEIFQLSRNEHLNTKEIASKLKLSPKTVENQLNIALKQVKASLSKYMIFFL